jgi:hypothetical protein
MRKSHADQRVGGGIGRGRMLQLGRACLENAFATASCIADAKKKAIPQATVAKRPRESWHRMEAKQCVSTAFRAR